MGSLGPGAGCDGPIAKIARDFRLILDEPAVTLLDFKAGFEDVARGVVTGLDWVVVVIDPTTASLELANSMNRLVERLQAGALPATRHLTPELVAVANANYEQAHLKGVAFILNKIADDRIESFMRSRLAEDGIRPIAALREDPAITEGWLEGSPIFVPRLVMEATHILKELECSSQSSHGTAEVGRSPREEAHHRASA